MLEEASIVIMLVRFSIFLPRGEGSEEDNLYSVVESPHTASYESSSPLIN